MGKSESAECGSNCIEARQANHIRSRQKEDRGGTKGTLGEGAGGAEEGGVGRTWQVGGACCGDRRFRWRFGFECEVIKKRFVLMFDGNRVRGIVDEPKPFFLNEWEASEPFPKYPEP